jgi:hypothetical protein
MKRAHDEVARIAVLNELAWLDNPSFIDLPTSKEHQRKCKLSGSKQMDGYNVAVNVERDLVRCYFATSRSMRGRNSQNKYLTS